MQKILSIESFATKIDLSSAGLSKAAGEVCATERFRFRAG
jgi:hypothetical protein